MLSQNDIERLDAAGFIKYEIAQIASATDPSGVPQPAVNLNDSTWQNVMKSRSEWVDRQYAGGKTKDELEAQILAYYFRRSKRTPFTFIQEVYKDKTQNPNIDYRTAVRNRAKRQARKVGQLYGRK